MGARFGRADDAIMIDRPAQSPFLQTHGLGQERDSAIRGQASALQPAMEGAIGNAEFDGAAMNEAIC